MRADRKNRKEERETRIVYGERMKRLTEKQRQFQMRRNKKRFPKEVKRAAKRRAIRHEMKLVTAKYRKQLRSLRHSL